jgi:hypothetical protein
LGAISGHSLQVLVPAPKGRARKFYSLLAGAVPAGFPLLSGARALQNTFPPGIYVVEITDQSGKLKKQVLVKQ